MFRIIFLLSFMLMSLFMSAQPKEILLDIRGTTCSGGLGNCEPDRIKPNTSTMKMYTATKLDFNKVSFEIDTAKLTPEEQITFFGKEYKNLKPTDQIEFTQNSDYIFDLDMLIYLELDLLYGLLKRGSYPVTIDKDKVKVTFTLSFHR